MTETEKIEDYTTTRTADEHLALSKAAALALLDADWQNACPYLIAELREHAETRGKAVPLLQKELNRKPKSANVVRGWIEAVK